MQELVTGESLTGMHRAALVLLDSSTQVGLLSIWGKVIFSAFIAMLLT